MSHPKLVTKEYKLPFIFITSLFFLWGLAHGMLDTLDKHFQEILHLHKWQSSLIQFALYGAYFSMAIPAGMFMKRYGYKKGIVVGLFIFASGALLVAATAVFESFWIFLSCLFLIGSGLATLETAANPYTTKLGPKETAERRINLSQSFNGLAWVLGPLIALYIYNSTSEVVGEKLYSTILPMLIIGLLVLAVAFVFMHLKLPEITEEDEVHAHGFIESSFEEKSTFHIPLKKQPHFVLGVIAQFSYVAAQTGIFSYLINFVTDAGQDPKFDVKLAPFFLSIGFALFMLGRISGSYIMSLVKPTKLLAICAGLAAILLPVVSLKLGWISLISLYTVFFVMSIMFPTIFALAIKDLGPQTKKASSFLVMAVVGGAVFPPLMGLIADHFGMSIGFLVPIPFFVFIAYYALRGHIIRYA